MKYNERLINLYSSLPFGNQNKCGVVSGTKVTGTALRKRQLSLKIWCQAHSADLNIPRAPKKIYLDIKNIRLKNCSI